MMPVTRPVTVPGQGSAVAWALTDAEGSAPPGGCGLRVGKGRSIRGNQRPVAGERFQRGGQSPLLYWPAARVTWELVINAKRSPTPDSRSETAF